MKIIRASDVENILRKYLNAERFTLSRQLRHGETGPDLVATKNGGRFLFEIIGFQKNPSLRSREFYECFFRVISRYQEGNNDKLIIALPIRFATGMPQRKRQYGIAWIRLGNAFPNLKIWYVDTKKKKPIERSWNNCGIDRIESLRGLVIKEWRKAGKPTWDLGKAVSIAKECDRKLMDNPAKAFRKARTHGEESYLKQWIRGCKFSWLKK